MVGGRRRWGLALALSVGWPAHASAAAPLPDESRRDPSLARGPQSSAPSPSGSSPNDSPANGSSPNDSLANGLPTTDTSTRGAPSDAVEVRVVGSRDDALQRMPGSATVIGAKEVARARPADTGEILRRVPGLQVRQEEGLGLRLNVGVRGLDPTRSRLVLVLEDGMPVAINPYSDPDLYYSTPVERIRGVEVVKGSGNILFGPQTIGGVINFTTVPLPDRETWVAEGQLGQRDFKKLVAGYGDAVGDVRYVLQVARKSGDGFRGIGFDTTDVLGKVGFATGKRGTAVLKVAAYDENSNSTYVGLTRDMAAKDPRQPTVAPHDAFHIRRYDVSLTHELAFASWKLRTFVYAYTTHRAWHRQNYDRAPVDGMSYERVVGDASFGQGAIYFRNADMIRNRAYEVMGIEPQLEHRFDTWGVGHTLTLGTRLHGETGDRRQSQGASVASLDGALETHELNRAIAVAAYAQDRLHVRDDFLVTPGVRVEHADYQRTIRRAVGADGVSRDVFIRGTSNMTAVIPGLGMVVGTPSANLFSSMHAGFAPPRVAQAVTGTGVDAQLDPERSLNGEVGLRGRLGRWWRGEVVGYVLSFENQIIAGTASSGLQSELVNGGKTLHQGVELSTSFGVGQALRWPLTVDIGGRFTAARSVFRGGPFAGNRLPYAPTHLASATLDVEHSGVLGGTLGANTAISYTGAQYTDEYNIDDVDPSGRIGKLSPYVLLDVGARYTHRGTGLTGFVTVKNALDNVYVSTRLPDGIFTAGFRQVNLGLRWER